MATNFAFLATIVAFLLIITLVSSCCNEGLEQMIPFSYTGDTGPERWAALNPNFTVCSAGEKQSPINIVKEACIHNHDLKPLVRDYSPANATLVNNGFNVGMRYDGNAGVLSIDGKTYSLVQMHWHAPSEHRINGFQYAAELHLVHTAEDGSISVVAVLYHYGHPNHFVTKIQNKLSLLTEELYSRHELGQITLGDVNAERVKKTTQKYYRYTGSFTTPPCTENVIWNILDEVRSISREQVEALRSPLVWGCKNNSRPAQPLNGRQVEMYEHIIN